VSDGIWDGDEWISWDWIDQPRSVKDQLNESPEASFELIEMFEDLVNDSVRYKSLTGRYLPLFGELGELYAEIRYGIDRHRPRAAGSDGRLGDDFVEVKTIGPEKSSAKVQVKRADNFSKLLVVKISENYKFDARMIDRKTLETGQGEQASVAWANMPESEPGQ
jgi:hypothetical protein